VEKHFLLKYSALYVLLLGSCLMACPKAGVVVRERQGVKARAPEEGQVLGALPIHTVLKGDTFYSIARNHHVPLEGLLAVNGLRETDILHIGQQLLIPQASAAALKGKQVAEVEASLVAEGLKLEWPLKGMLYAKFGKKGKEVHDGVDLAAPLGTPVKAAAAGKVLYAGEQKGYGKIVIVEHSAGLITLYAHNHELRVQTGDVVATGAVIATVGQSGRTSGPHLHFELRKNGLPVDPLPYFRLPP